MNFASTPSIIYPSSSDDQSTDYETLFTGEFSSPFFFGDGGGVDSPPFPRWSWTEDKAFETGLVMFPDGTPDSWRKIAERLPGKTPAQVLQHYEDLLRDLIEIDAGRCDWLMDGDSDDDEEDDQVMVTCVGSGTGFGRETSSERRRGTPWSEEEHRRFVDGLERYGKGDWRSISRNAVISRTPTQVASHAQKYFLRLNAGKNKRRPSIHDVRPGSIRAEPIDSSEVLPGMDEEAQQLNGVNIS